MLSRSGCRLKPAFQAVIPSTGGTLPSGSSCGDDWGGTVPPCSAPRVPTRGRRSRTGGAVNEGSGAPFRCALAQRVPAEAGVPSRYCRDRGGSVSSCVCDADGWRDAVSTASGRSMPAGGRRSEHTPTGTTGASTGLEAGVHCGIESPGDDLLSHSAAAAVPSALEDFTTVFGMGTGVAPPLGSPGQKMIRSKCGSV